MELLNTVNNIEHGKYGIIEHVIWILNTVNITVNIEHDKLLTVKYGY